MTKRTYTAAEVETLVNAVVAAALQDVRDKINAQIAPDMGAESLARYVLTVVAKQVSDMIPQSGTVALNALIGAVYLDAADSFPGVELPAPIRADIKDAILDSAPADALAALERVKQETLAQATTSVMIERMAKEIYAAMRFDREEEAPEWVDGGNSFAQDAARDAAKRIAAAIRGESDE